MAPFKMILLCVILLQAKITYAQTTETPQNNASTSQLSAEEQKLKAFLDDIEPILQQWINQFKEGMLELGPNLNKKLVEWKTQLGLYKNVSDPTLVSRRMTVQWMIQGLYDPSQGKPTRAMRGKTTTNPLLETPKTSPAKPEQLKKKKEVTTKAQQTDKSEIQKPKEKKEFLKQPIPKKEETKIQLRGDRRQKEVLETLWQKFLQDPDNQNLWNKIRTHKNFKEQVLEFGLTGGTLVHLESIENGVIIKKVDGKLTYYVGLEEKAIEELTQIERTALEKLENSLAAPK